MKRTIPEIFSGLAIFGLITALVGFSIFFGIFPGNVENWLLRSGDPRQALIFFSLMAGTILMMLARVGVEVVPFSMIKGDNVKRYINGLPLWVLFFFLTISIFGFANVSPTCKAPETVVFEDITNQRIFQPANLMEVAPNESLTIIASSPDKSQISCISWEFVGPAFPTLGAKDDCQVNITFSDQPGPSYITLLATQNFCNEASLFSLEVQVK